MAVWVLHQRIFIKENLLFLQELPNENDTSIQGVVISIFLILAIGPRNLVTENHADYRHYIIFLETVNRSASHRG